MDLNLVNILFGLNSRDPVSSQSQLYDAVRRFESCFKSVSCSHADHACHLCGVESENCPYLAVFGQALSTDPDVVRRHQKPPLPFAFKISNIDSNTSCTELRIVIAGNAIQHASKFLSAIERMVDSVAAGCDKTLEISGIWCLDYRGGCREFSKISQELVLLSAMEILQTPFQSDVVKIYADTPLRLFNSGSIVHSFDFGNLLRSQLRRCSSFFAYYGEGELDLDYAFLSEAAENVTTLDSRFSFSKPLWTKRIGLSGLLGSGEFTDLAEGVVPLLILGSYLNAGKGASYGFGVYRIE